MLLILYIKQDTLLLKALSSLFSTLEIAESRINLGFQKTI